MITGVLKPDAGTLELDGRNIETQPLEAKKLFGFVPDSPDLLLRLTGREYAEFMADVYQVDPDTRKQRLEALAREFEMTDALDTRMSDYSHGMRQKAIIIGALMSDPDIWILDEPMTGLDPEAENERTRLPGENRVLFHPCAGSGGKTLRPDSAHQPGTAEI